MIPRRCLSSEVSVTENPVAALVQRHGPGDAMVVLSVGGTKFFTLRSTVNSNEVLSNHVAQAEINKAITQDGAVFIDRDPKHFPFILQFLRDRADGKALPRAGSKMKKKLMGGDLALPKDTKLLQEIYNEAAYYRISELQSALCSTGYFTLFASFFSGGQGNPFTAATNWFSRLRASMVALTTLGGTVALTTTDIKDLPRALLFQNDKTKK